MGSTRGSGSLIAAVLSLLAVAGATGCDSERAPTLVRTSSVTPPAPTDAVPPVALPTAALPSAPADGFAGPVIVRIGDAPPLRVEIAARPDQRARGLMQRPDVPDGTGMLFLFPAPSSGGFWMLGTLVPLSIAYVAGDRVVSIAEMRPCPPSDARCPTYPADGSYTAAVEAPGGFFTEHGVGPGARMTIAGPTPAPR